MRISRLNSCKLWVSVKVVLRFAGYFLTANEMWMSCSKSSCQLVTRGMKPKQKERLSVVFVMILCLWKAAHTATRHSYLWTIVTVTSSLLVATSLRFLKEDYIQLVLWHGQHPDEKLHRCEESSITHKHTHRPILSQCPAGRSFVCVYGLKCCWQVKINPTLLFSFPAPSLAVHFFLSSPSHLFPSFIKSLLSLFARSFYPRCVFLLSLFTP